MMIIKHRKSNIELLRLVLMFFILMHHYLLKGGVLNAGFQMDSELDLSAAFLDPFFFVGVNCFVLISGYFGIRFSFRGLYKLFIQCAFYGLLFYILHLWNDQAKVGKSIVYNFLFVFSTPPGWWFIRVYVYLYLLSPILNKAIENLNQPQFKSVLLLLTILNIYFGYIRKTPFNLDGYNIANFVYLYFIGRYLKIYGIENKGSTIKYFLGYIICSVVMGIMVLVKNQLFQHDTVLPNVYVYNNPVLIMAAVFLLLAFASINITYSKIINWLSFSALSIYLISENSYFEQWYYSYVGNCVNELAPLSLWLSLLSIAIVTMICCLIVDKIRILITTPIDKYLLSLMDRLDSKCKALNF